MQFHLFIRIRQQYIAVQDVGVDRRKAIMIWTSTIMLLVLFMTMQFITYHQGIPRIRQLLFINQEISVVLVLIRRFK